MREKIFSIIEPSNGDSKISTIYDIFMIIAIVVSLIPLAFKEVLTVFIVIDKVCAAIFIIDYLLRFITADYKYGKKSVVSFLRYPIVHSPCPATSQQTPPYRSKRPRR